MRRIAGLNTSKHDKCEGGEVKVSTVNVGSMMDRSGEVVEMLTRRKVDICWYKKYNTKEKDAKCLAAKRSTTNNYSCGQEKRRKEKVWEYWYEKI